MKRPTLLRQRAIWFPTLWGWLLVLAVSAATGLLVLRHLHAYLSPNRPVGARILVVEGWMSPDELDQALQAFEAGGYERIVTTGGPIESWAERLGRNNYAELAEDHLLHRGLAPSSIRAVPCPASAQERTFLSAVMVREWLQRAGTSLDALDVFSSGVHSRRSWLLYQMAFGPRVRIGIRAARPGSYDPEAWWRTSAGTKAVLAETLSYLWTELFFHPGVAGSHEEKWGDPGDAPHTDSTAPSSPGSGRADASKLR